MWDTNRTVGCLLQVLEAKANIRSQATIHGHHIKWACGERQRHGKGFIYSLRRSPREARARSYCLSGVSAAIQVCTFQMKLVPMELCTGASPLSKRAYSYELLPAQVTAQASKHILIHFQWCCLFFTPVTSSDAICDVTCTISILH